MTQTITIVVITLFLLFCISCFFIRRKSVSKRIVSTVCALSLLGSVFSPVIKVFAENDNNNQTQYRQQSFELHPNEQKTEETVILDGIMPKNSTVEAVDVTEQVANMDGFVDSDTTANTTDTENTDASVVVAYDITITDSNKEEYQPQENQPIYVEIFNTVIDEGSPLELWHIKDDGTREQVTDFTIEDGKISFYAKGFSVYAIVTPTHVQASSLADLTGARSGLGFYLHYDKTYFRNTMNNNGNALNTTDITTAVYNSYIWFFEKEGDYYKIYSVVGGVNKYIHNTTGNDIELSETDYDLFEITKTGDYTFQLKKKDEAKYLQYSSGIRYNTSTYGKIIMDFADTSYLNGKTYGLINYSGGTLGYALMATGTDQNVFELKSLIVKEDNGRKTLYVAENRNISAWTFNYVSPNCYTLSTQVNGVTKYLKLNNSTVRLVDDVTQASTLKVAYNTVDNKVRLTDISNNRSVHFNNNNNSIKFTANQNSSSVQWLYLVDNVGLSQEDYITYSADKVGVSDDAVTNGTSVIVYTRIWNDEKKTYEFYAVDHDGSLYPCYERGDQIMWVGNKINTLLWNFIEYYDTDGVTPSYYYELYNPYSGKYIAPNIESGQTISDNKIGINMPGRREEEYHTTIIAWDDVQYAYAGIYADIEQGKISPTKRKNASTFYFAIVETATNTLTKVNTLDNNLYGITMKMIDFPKQTSNDTATTGSLQNYYLQNGKWRQRQATLGLLSTNLNDNDYPTMTGSNKNLAELFDPEEGSLYPNGTTVPASQTSQTVNHLFIESIYNASGYFEFDSCQNYATLISEGTTTTRQNDFIVYKELGTTNDGSKTTLQHGQFYPYNTIKQGVYSTSNPENLYGALSMPGQANTALLEETDPRKYEKLHAIQGTVNYYNGMEMSASFIQPPDGKDAWGHDIIFEFTGDDDFWLYVDGELVIDLGGIHSALEGKVNFSTGEVVLGGRGTETNEVIITTTLRELFRQNYLTRNPDATSAEVNAFLSEYFDDGETVFRDYTSHSMRIFYMERGAGASNLHMRFNLNHVTPGHVMLTKELTGVQVPDFDLVEYPYQIFYRVVENGPEMLLTNEDNLINVTYQNSTQQVKYLEHYTPPGSTVTYDGVYLLQPGKSAEIHFPSDTVEYRVVECAINEEVYNIVHVNDLSVEGVYITNGTENTDRKNYDSGWIEVKRKPSIVYKNNVVESALRTLSFHKKLLDAEGNELTAEDDDTTFNFRLWLSNGADDTLELANMYKYYVKDNHGHLCRWDSDTQKFVSTEKTNHSTLSQEEDDLLSFETSINGAISKIPAGYTIEIPKLPIGMKFKVEERDSEIPLGYSFSEYQREGNTYRVENGDDDNIGEVVPLQSPYMTVENKRGWGLQATKVWSDSDFTESHDNIYTAVYVNNILVSDTVRKIKDPETTVSYFFEHLQEGTTLENYLIYEVKLTDPVVHDDGTVTYSAIEQARTISVPVTPPTTKVPEYVVEYEQGTITGANNHIRKDTITNVRKGGLVISLYDMVSRYDENNKIPLADGVFVLKRGDTVLGTFTSDVYGRITIVYDFEHDVDYTLTQTSPPDKYIPVPNTITFQVNGTTELDGSLTVTGVTVSGNPANWQNGYQAGDSNAALVAFIEVFNKPYNFSAVKVESDTNDPLEGAVFTLYRSVSGIDGETQDTNPYPGYEEMISDENGVLTELDNTLPPGKYYLEETSAPFGYEILEEPIVFTLSETGEITINSTEHISYLTTEDNLSGTATSYTISIPNAKLPDGDDKLTLSHTVNADNVNSGLKLETLSVANMDVFKVKLGTKYMQAGTNNDVTVPLELNFRRKSPNYIYINGNARYPAHHTYAQKTVVTQKTNRLDIIQTRKEQWSPTYSEINNAQSDDGSYFTDITAYYTWRDTAKQLDINGNPLVPTVKSATGQGVGVPTNGIVSLLYDQTAIFRNQFPSTVDSNGNTPLISFQLQTDISKFQTSNSNNSNIDATTGIMGFDSSSRTYNDFYETDFKLVGGTYTETTTVETARTTGSGEFKVTSNNMALEYTHNIKTGSVTISKKLEGKVGDKDADGKKTEYTFVISYRNLFGCRVQGNLTKEAFTLAENLIGTLSGTDALGHSYDDTNYYTADDPKKTVKVKADGTFTLVEGASVTFSGIPVGTNLKVEEISSSVEYYGEALESRVSKVTFSGVISDNDNLSTTKDGAFTKNNLTPTSEGRYTVSNNNTYEMINNANWTYEVYNTYSPRIPVLYRYIDRYIVNGQATDLRNNYTYFIKGISTEYENGLQNGSLSLKDVARSDVCSSAPQIYNVLCNYSLSANGVYYDDQNTFYRDVVRTPSGTSKSHFEVLNVSTELNAILDAMYGDDDDNSTINETAYNALHDDCTTSGTVSAQDSIIGLKDSLRSIINRAILNSSSALTKAQLIAKLQTTDYFYYNNGEFYIIQATYANHLRLYDVNVQLVVPNDWDASGKTLTETKTIGNYQTGDYINIKYEVPFNGITNLSHTANAVDTDIINALGLSSDAKELYHITTADGRQLYFGYWERIVSYHDGKTTKTTFTPVSTNFNYHYRVNDHVTIRAVYQEANKAGSESSDSRKRYEPGKTFAQEEEFVPFDTEKNRTIERLYNPVQKTTHIIFWEEDDNGNKMYKDSSGRYSIPEALLEPFGTLERFDAEAFHTAHPDITPLYVQTVTSDATLTDTGYLTVNGITTANSSIGNETELYQVSYMVPNEEEQVGYASSATDRTYNNYSVQTASGKQDRTRVDVVFGGIGSADSDVDIEQVGYVLFQSPKTGDNAKYGNTQTFRNALTLGGSLRNMLIGSVSASVTDSKIVVTQDTTLGDYKVRMSMTKVTKHADADSTLEPNPTTNGVVLTNKNRVNIVFDMPNNENTQKSFYTCYTVMKIKDNNGEAMYRISATPVTFNLMEVKDFTEQNTRKTYFLNMSNGTAVAQSDSSESYYEFNDTNPELGYLGCSNYTTVVDGKSIVLTPHFFDKTEGTTVYKGRFVKVTIGKKTLTDEQIAQLNRKEDLEIIFNASEYLNNPNTENSVDIKVYMEKYQSS